MPDKTLNIITPQHAQHPPSFPSSTTTTAAAATAVVVVVASDEVLSVVDGQKDTCSRMLRVRLYIARPVRLPCSQTMASTLRTLFNYPFQARRRRPRRSLRLSAWLFWRLHSSSSPCALAVASSAGARTHAFCSARGFCWAPGPTLFHRVSPGFWPWLSILMFSHFQTLAPTPGRLGIRRQLLARFDGLPTC